MNRQTILEAAHTIAFAGVVLFILAVFGYVAIVNAGPYLELECTDNGYSISQNARMHSETIKHPDQLCERKQAAIHPTVFDARVAIEHTLGMGDYTWDEAEVKEEIPPPRIYLWPLGDTSTPNRTLSCREAGEWVGMHPDARVGVKIVNWPFRYQTAGHPAQVKMLRCEMAFHDGVDAAHGKHDLTGGSNATSK